jgi:serine O-acetyltransferase
MMSFRRDVARWIVPQSIGDSDDVSVGLALRLLFRHPPLRAMAWIRFAQWCRARGIRGVGGFVQHRLLRVYGLELAPSTPVGGGLYIAHPVGCVLHAASIGENVTVIGQVTLGYSNDARWPTIGDRAYLGVGARVLGGITVGADARVGANAVVIQDVPAGATAVGIPARVLSQRET